MDTASTDHQYNPHPENRDPLEGDTARSEGRRFLTGFAAVVSVGDDDDDDVRASLDSCGEFLASVGATLYAAAQLRVLPDHVPVLELAQLRRQLLLVLDQEGDAVAELVVLHLEEEEGGGQVSGEW